MEPLPLIKNSETGDVHKKVNHSISMSNLLCFYGS